MSEPIYLRIVERGNELIITTQRERLTWRDIVRLRFPVDIELSWVDPAPPVRALVEEMVARWNAVESASPCAFVISDGELCGEEVRHPIHFMDKSWHEGRPTHFYVPTGEEAWWSCALCGFSAAILCKECRSARHMPAPRGATCSERHHEYQTPVRSSFPAGEGEEVCGIYYAGGRQCTMRPDEHDPALNHVYTPVPARPSSPTGETPCATCGGRGRIRTTDGTMTTGHVVFEMACPDCQPTEETAGQGVEEAWRRSVMPKGFETWTAPNGDTYQIEQELAQAIRAEAAREATEAAQLSCLEATGCSAVLRAEAERDRLREALDELVERWLRYSKEAQGKPDSDYDRGRAFAYWIAADSLTAVLAAVQPPPRDPAGEGE